MNTNTRVIDMQTSGGSERAHCGCSFHLPAGALRFILSAVEWGIHTVADMHARMYSFFKQILSPKRKNRIGKRQNWCCVEVCKRKYQITWCLRFLTIKLILFWRELFVNVLPQPDIKHFYFRNIFGDLTEGTMLIDLFYNLFYNEFLFCTALGCFPLTWN